MIRRPKRTLAHLLAIEMIFVAVGVSCRADSLNRRLLHVG